MQERCVDANKHSGVRYEERHWDSSEEEPITTTTTTRIRGGKRIADKRFGGVAARVLSGDWALARLVAAPVLIITYISRVQLGLVETKARCFTSRWNWGTGGWGWEGEGEGIRRSCVPFIKKFFITFGACAIASCWHLDGLSISLGWAFSLCPSEARVNGDFAERQIGPWVRVLDRRPSWK